MSEHFEEISGALALVASVAALRHDELRPRAAKDLVDGGLPGRGCDPVPDRSWLRGGPFSALCEAVPLDDLELLLLAAAAAPAVDERFEPMLAALSGRRDNTEVTAEVLRNLAARTVAGRARATAALAPDGLLRRSRLLEVAVSDHGPLAGQVTVPPRVLQLLVDTPSQAPELEPDFPAVPLRTVHTLDDLVVAPVARRRIEHVVERIQQQPTVMDDWGLGTHHDCVSGVTVLLHGPSGTGKTLTAAVLAAEAGLRALRVDLSTLVSKYIGETAKNLERVFRHAEANPCVLFFDEADSVFGKRGDVTDARDRYANQEVSYLLQRVESFPGIVVLATNLLANIDQAFLRRVDVIIELAAPNKRLRRDLWHRVYPETVPTGELPFERLGDSYQLTGAQIKDAAIEAAYQAAANGGVVTAEHLERAVKEQFTKSGLMVPD